MCEKLWTLPLAVERYAWSGAARALESFYRWIMEVGS
jgi:hypothetical protein